MDKETKEALRESIRRWEVKTAVTKLDMFVGVSLSRNECPLCDIFYKTDDAWCCRGCPVSMKTKHAYCVGTPYNATWYFRKNVIMDGGRFTAAEWQKIAGAEVTFLKSLMPCGEDE